MFLCDRELKFANLYGFLMMVGNSLITYYGSFYHLSKYLENRCYARKETGWVNGTRLNQTDLSDCQIKVYFTYILHIFEYILHMHI